MAATFKTLVQGAYLPNATGIMYSAVQRTRIDRLTLTNQTAGSITVTLYIIQSGGAVANNYRVIHTHFIAANETLDIDDMRHFMEKGDSIRAVASAANSVSMRASGVIFT